LGLAIDGAGVAGQVFENLGIDLRLVRQEVGKVIKAGTGDTLIAGKRAQTPRAKKAVEYSIEQARALNHNYVGTEHLLLGLLLEGEGVGATVLMKLGVTFDKARAEILNVLGPSNPG